MAKETGLGARLLVDGYNISGDITSVGSLGGGPTLLDATGIDKAGMERVGGLLDGGAEFTSWWNPGPEADAAHLVLSTLPTTSRHLAYLHRNTAGAPAACAIAKQVNYDHSRADDGAFTAQTSAQIGDGFPLEWCKVITAGIVSLSGAGNGAGWDSTITSSAFGFVAYLQVLAFTGTSVTAKIQDSADGAVWADLTGGGFTAATGRGGQRIAAAGTVRRHFRVVTTGTFTAAELVVALYRREVTP
ncbi:MAG: hypothetical protein L0K86_15935 [Actinomycetia bacterium]|nr:hypothetical protein [Actinomycetes bacterium]